MDIEPQVLLAKILGQSEGSLLDYAVRFKDVNKKGLVGTLIAPTEYDWNVLTKRMKDMGLTDYGSDPENIIVTEAGKKVYSLVVELSSLIR